MYDSERERNKKIKRNMKYLAEVDERRRTKRKRQSLKQYGKDNDHGAIPFRRLPKKHRHIAWDVYNRLYQRAISQGKPITQQKIGSMMGNAMHITKHCILTRNYKKWTHTFFERRRAFQESISKPIISNAKLPKGASRVSNNLLGI